MVQSVQKFSSNLKETAESFVYAYAVQILQCQLSVPLYVRNTFASQLSLYTTNKQMP